MQLKGLVRFFAIALILICLYQLSFTWIVRSHEKSTEQRATAQVKANFLSPEIKYPGNKELQAAYAGTVPRRKTSDSDSGGGSCGSGCGGGGGGGCGGCGSS